MEQKEHEEEVQVPIPKKKNLLQKLKSLVVKPKATNKSSSSKYVNKK